MKNSYSSGSGSTYNNQTSSSRVSSSNSFKELQPRQSSVNSVQLPESLNKMVVTYLNSCQEQQTKAKKVMEEKWSYLLNYMKHYKTHVEQVNYHMEPIYKSYQSAFTQIRKSQRNLRAAYQREIKEMNRQQNSFQNLIQSQIQRIFESINFENKSPMKLSQKNSSKQSNEVSPITRAKIQKIQKRSNQLIEQYKAKQEERSNSLMKQNFTKQEERIKQLERQIESLKRQKDQTNISQVSSSKSFKELQSRQPSVNSTQLPESLKQSTQTIMKSCQEQQNNADSIMKAKWKVIQGELCYYKDFQHRINQPLQSLIQSYQNAIVKIINNSWDLREAYQREIKEMSRQQNSFQNLIQSQIQRIFVSINFENKSPMKLSQKNSSKQSKYISPITRAKIQKIKKRSNQLMEQYKVKQEERSNSLMKQNFTEQEKHKQQLKRQIEELTAQRDGMKKQNKLQKSQEQRKQFYKAQSQNLKTEVDQLDRKLRLANQQINSLKDENKRAIDSNKSLKTQVDKIYLQHKAQVGLLNQELQQANKQIDSLKDENQQAIDSNNSSKQQLEKQKFDIDEAHKKIIQLQIYQSKRQQKLKVKENEIETISKAAKDKQQLLQNHLESIKSQKISLENQVSHLQSKIEQNQKKSKEAYHQLAQKVIQRQNKQAKIQQLQKKNKQLTQNLKQQQKIRINDIIQRTSKKIEQQNNNLKAQIDNELLTRNSQKSQNNKKIQNLFGISSGSGNKSPTTKTTSTQQMIQNLKITNISQLKQLQNQNTQLRNQYQQILKTTKQYETQKQQFKKQCCKVVQEKLSLQQKLSWIEKKYQSLKDQIKKQCISPIQKYLMKVLETENLSQLISLQKQRQANATQARPSASQRAIQNQPKNSDGLFIQINEFRYAIAILLNAFQDKIQKKQWKIDYLSSYVQNIEQVLRNIVGVSNKQLSGGNKQRNAQVFGSDVKSRQQQDSLNEHESKTLKAMKQMLRQKDVPVKNPCLQMLKNFAEKLGKEYQNYAKVMNGKIKQSTAQIEKIRQQKQNSSQKLKKNQAILNDLRNQIIQLKESKEALQTEKRRKEQSNRKLQDQIQQSKAQLENTKESRNKLQQQVRSLTKISKQQQLKLKGFEDQQSRGSQNINLVKEKLDKQQAVKLDMQKKLNQKVDEVNRKTAEIEKNNVKLLQFKQITQKLASYEETIQRLIHLLKEKIGLRSDTFSLSGICQQMQNFQPRLGQKLITSSILSGNDTARNSLIKSIQAFQKMEIERTQIKFRFDPQNKSAMGYLPSKSRNDNFALLIIFQTKKGNLFGSYSMGLQMPTYLFSLIKGQIKEYHKFQKASDKVMSVSLESIRQLSWGSTEMKIKTAQFDEVMINPSVIGDTYFGQINWAALVGEEPHVIKLEASEIHKVTFKQ